MERDLARGHELDDRRRLAWRDVFVRADHDARLRRSEPPALTGAVDVPLALHAHVRVEDHVFAVGGERDEEVLAVRLDGLHGAADDLSPRGGRRHLRSDEIESGDNAASESATQHGRRAKDRVAFGHPGFRSARRAGDSRAGFARIRPRAAHPRWATRPRERRRRIG